MSSTNHFSLKVVTSHTCLLGEGPLWHSKRKTISWIDILQGEIHEFSVMENRHHVIPVKDMVGTIAHSNTGDYLAALKNGVAFVNNESGEMEFLCHPEAHIPGNRFNDGKCDPLGRLWVGTMAISEEPGAGNLYMIDKDFSHTKKIEGVTISNGMAWSSDHRIFYYIDTPTCEVVAYDFDLPTGNISNKRVVIKIPQGEGYPDGMTIDNEGMLWIAHWDGWQVSRWDPNTGKKLLSIPIPVAQVTSCTFGGYDLQDLYITTARVNLTEEQLKQQPLAGSLFVIRDCGFQGTEAYFFRG